MDDVIEIIPEELQDNIEKKDFPQWINPMKATLTNDYFSDPDWIFERKLDGIRCLAFKKGKEVSLYSRNEKKQNSIYPEIVEAFETLEGDFVIDGEIIAFDKHITSFSKLQNRMKNNKPDKSDIKNTPVFFYAFDMMYYDKYDLTDLPLKKRKSLLKKSIAFKDPIRFTTHRNEKGEKYHKEACKNGWEGLIAKKADSTYVHSRSKNWLKFKCVNEQEFVIVGFTDPAGSRIGFGALLIGYYDNDELKYAGKVGTGFNDELLNSLSKKLQIIESKEAPVASEKVTGKSRIHWVKPEMVCQIAFTEWTRDNKLRHPRFQGIRKDKKPTEVVKEEPQ